MAHRWFPGFSALALLVLTAGCGGEVGGSGGSGTGGSGGTGTGGTSTGGTSTGGTSTGGTSTGGALPFGDCGTAADCGGNPCVEVTPGGFKICTSFPAEATQCTPNNPVPDECCTSADCAEGKCYSTADIPYCGGPAMAIYNRCVADECTSDADCAGGIVPSICAPAGAWGNPNRMCLTAYCKTVDDCAAKKPGSYCAPVDAPCCPVAAGLACVDVNTGCREDQDCASDGSKHCEIDGATGEGVCKDGPAACPA